jgi:hypothetical protein
MYDYQSDGVWDHAVIVVESGVDKLLVSGRGDWTCGYLANTQREPFDQVYEFIGVNEEFVTVKGLVIPY